MKIPTSQRPYDGSINNIYSTNYLKDHSLDHPGVILDQQPTFALNSNTQHFKQNHEFISEQQKSKSSRLQNVPGVYFNRVQDRNLRIDVSHGGIPENQLNESCKTDLSYTS